MKSILQKLGGLKSVYTLIRQAENLNSKFFFVGVKTESSVCSKLFLICLFCALGIACSNKGDLKSFDEYKGPISIATNIHLVNSDSGIVRTELFAKKRLEYANGDMEFPDGIIVHYRNVAGEVTSKISADRGFFNKSENLYTGSGNVQVTNLEKKQQLNSEELFWEPNKQRIYTNAFVIIKENDRIIKGTGMEADDKFTNYKIFKSHGEIPIPGEDG
jgi:LPS export ABC transporter protein LptC